MKIQRYVRGIVFIILYPIIPEPLKVVWCDITRNIACTILYLSFSIIRLVKCGSCSLSQNNCIQQSTPVDMKSIECLSKSFCRFGSISPSHYLLETIMFRLGVPHLKVTAIDSLVQTLLTHLCFRKKKCFSVMSFLQVLRDASGRIPCGCAYNSRYIADHRDLLREITVALPLRRRPRPQDGCGTSLVSCHM